MAIQRNSGELPPVALRSVESIFVGGETIRLEGLPVVQRSMVLNGAPRTVDPNGDYVFGQLYAQVFRLQQPRHALPIVLWHGGGMTGCTWETTPDGRPGWLWLFLQAGYDVIVCDAPERGRASWARYPEIYSEPPVFRTKEEAWRVFRFGPYYDSVEAKREVFEGQRFPVQCFDYFAKQWVPRWPGHEQLALSAYEKLVEQVGCCVVVAHSQGAGYAAEVARRLPNTVAKVVAVEPGGMPDGDPTAALPPHLLVWGDFIEQVGAYWINYRRQAQTYVERIRAKCEVNVLDLPDIGIRGNSHFPMMDDNSDVVFSKVLQWIEE